MIFSGHKFLSSLRNLRRLDPNTSYRQLLIRNYKEKVKIYLPRIYSGIYVHIYQHKVKHKLVRR
jgi:hypothetical protein